MNARTDTYDYISDLIEMNSFKPLKKLDKKLFERVF
jgi:hypothetical protein